MSVHAWCSAGEVASPASSPSPHSLQEVTHCAPDPWLWPCRAMVWVLRRGAYLAASRPPDSLPARVVRRASARLSRTAISKQNRDDSLRCDRYTLPRSELWKRNASRVAPQHLASLQPVRGTRSPQSESQPPASPATGARFRRLRPALASSTTLGRVSVTVDSLGLSAGVA